MLTALSGAISFRVPVPESVVDRIDRLVKEAVAAGKYKSANQFWSAKGCGLSRSYLPQFRLRLADNPSATLTVDTAAKIAAALGLPVRAITGGNDDPAPTDRYPNRSWAVQAARDLLLSETAIQAILKENHGRDLTRIAWFLRIHAEAERLRPASGL